MDTFRFTLAGRPQRTKRLHQHQQRNPRECCEVLFAVSFLVLESESSLGQGKAVASHRHILRAYRTQPVITQMRPPPLPT
jgi:hypothetical protein